MLVTVEWQVQAFGFMLLVASIKHILKTLDYYAFWQCLYTIVVWVQHLNHSSCLMYELCYAKFGEKLAVD